MTDCVITDIFTVTVGHSGLDPRLSEYMKT